MSWTKTKNVHSSDLTDPLVENSVLNTNLIGSTWGSGTPASSKENAAFQKIIMDVVRRMIRRQGQSGFVSRPTFLFSASYPSNSFNTPRSEVYIDGLGATLVGSNLNSETEASLQLNAPPSSGTRLDLVFLECWIVEIAGSIPSAQISTNKPDATHLFKYGNVNFGGTNPLDDINEVAVEINRRVQVQYRVRAVPGVNFSLYPNGINDPAVAAQGPNVSPTAINFIQSSTDTGLFIAGNGTTAHQDALGTLDGFVYAIPMAQVNRLTGETSIDPNNVTDLRRLWGGADGTVPTLPGDNVFTGRQQFAKGADLAPGGSVITIGTDGNFFTVNGSGPFTGISSLRAGISVDLLFPNPVNLIHSDTTFVLPYRRIYRTVMNEVVTFISTGTGWIAKARSGPADCVGTSVMFNGLVVPDGYQLEYVQPLSMTAFEGLLSEYLASGFMTNVGAPIWSAFSVNAATDEVVISNHGRVAGDVVMFTSTSSMPGGLTGLTKYFVQSVTGSNTFKVAATRGGAAINITTSGSGSLSAYNTFYAGDMSGRVAVGADNMGGVQRNVNNDTAGNTVGAKAGEWRHTMTIGELVAHTHNVSIRATVGVFGSPGGNGWDGLGNVNSGSAGSGIPFNVMQPYQTKLSMVRT